MQGRRDGANYQSSPRDRVDTRELAHGSQTHSYDRYQNNTRQTTQPVNERSSASGQSQSGRGGVGFRTQSDEYQEERKKYLTAKYGSQQMKLIRKRLSVEFWIDDQLKKLYNVENDTETYDADLDLDEILDLPDNHQRMQYIWNQVCNAPKSERERMAFVNELVQKASSL